MEGTIRWAAMSAASTSTAPVSADSHQRRPGRARDAARDLRRRERDEEHRPDRHRDAGDERDGEQHEREPRALDAHAEPVRGVVAELERTQRPARGGERRREQRRSPPSSGQTSSQPRVLSEPSSQRVASCASSIRARESRKSVTAISSALIAMPTSTSRWPEAPPRVNAST